MTTPTLSILTPAIPARLAQSTYLSAEIERQSALFPGQIEHLIFCDTRGARTVGEKRDALLRLSRGRYVAFCDDDDLVLPGYVESLLNAAGTGADVITFRQEVSYCGQSGIVCFGLGNTNEPFTPGGVTKRAPWHVCAFRAEIAKLHHFPATNYGEDWAWARHVVGDCKSSTHVDKILHKYIHSLDTTAAPPPNG